MAADTFGRDLRSLGVTAEQSARKQVEASVKRDARLRSEVVAYREIAAAAKRGSREQVTAANLASQAERRLSGSVAATAREQRAFGVAAARSEREIGRATRGALAGSGIFRGLGRSIAFASGGFLAFASAGQLIRKSIDAATQAAATQRQLAAQFRANGESLGSYRNQIEEATLATSKLSGFTRDDLTQAFTTAYRGSKSVDVGLRIQAIAADVARGRHIALSTATIALTKAYGGQTTALRRLGVLVPTNLKGMQALEFVGRRFAGQAQAGTTAQERFAAALQTTEESIGTGLLPRLTQYLNRGTAWLDQQKNQERIQRDVTEAFKDGAQVLHAFAAGISLLSGPVKAVTGLLGGLHDAVQLLLAGFGVKKLSGLLSAEGLLGTNAAASAGKVDALTESLTKLTAAPWILTAVVAVKDIKDPASIPRRAKGLLNTIRGAGPGLAGALESLPTVGPVIGGLRAGLGPPKKEAQRLRNALDKSEQKFLNDVLSETLKQPGTVRLAPRGPLGFKAGFAQQELKLAQAQLTTQQADDRQVLVAEAQLIRERIKRIHGSQKHLAEETQLTQQLAGIQGQITQIDQQSSQTTIGWRKLELGLAQAQLTQTQGDDRKILVAEAAIVRAQIARLGNSNKTLDARTQLTQQLVGIEGQIASIDQEARQKQKDALNKQIQAVQQREQELRQKIKTIQDSFKQAIDNARQGIGDLFQGPVLAPTDAEIKARLGVPGPDPKRLTADLNAQVAQFARLQRDLAILGKRGAPKELLKELRAKGTEALPEIEALLKAPRQVFNAFLRAFGRRESLVQHVARVAMRAQLVVLRADRLTLERLQGRERNLSGRARRMATGGIVRSPTLALVGESGPEAVVPLSRISSGGGNDRPIHTHVYLNEHEIATAVSTRQTRSQRLITQQRRGGSAGRNPMGP